MFGIDYGYVNDTERYATDSDIEVFEIPEWDDVNVANLGNYFSFNRDKINRIGYLIDVFKIDNIESAKYRNIFAFKRKTDVDYTFVYALNINYAIFYFSKTHGGNYLMDNYTTVKPSVGDYIEIYELSQDIKYTEASLLSSRDYLKNFKINGYLNIIKRFEPFNLSK